MKAWLLQSSFAAWLFGFAVAGVLAGALGLDSVRRSNARVDAWLNGPADAVNVSDDAADPVKLAAAVRWIRAERYDEALPLLQNLLLTAGDPALRLAARFNLGNLHLRRALDLMKSDQQAQARTTAELAKAAYREVLGADPTLWDAKYNLEIAMRLSPEFVRIESGGGKEEDEADRVQHKVWTSVPGLPRGLP